MATEARLVVGGLTAKYGDRTILDGIDLTVRAGEVRVILGGSGSGKSTLLKNIIGLVRPAEGVVELLGVDLRTADEPQREAVMGRIGVLFQGGALLNSLTVEDNVALPIREKLALPEPVVREMVAMKLALVDLSHAGHLFPPELSGGMKKRAALARAMALDPEILFCDEPSAGLDPVTSAALDALLLSLKKRFGMSLVVVTHELASIEAIADKVTMLGRGRLIADGSLAEVKASGHPAVRAFFNREPESGSARTQSVFEALQEKGAAAPVGDGRLGDRSGGDRSGGDRNRGDRDRSDRDRSDRDRSDRDRSDRDRSDRDQRGGDES
ncbi:MAG: ATP-binding cassette domain-containing protein [Deltaproteobacteria bacterium]|nr:ATP-binding cassette domain-containing protein [Deltaproteobacteria bacterium]